MCRVALLVAVLSPCPWLYPGLATQHSALTSVVFLCRGLVGLRRRGSGDQSDHLRNSNPRFLCSVLLTFQQQIQLFSRVFRVLYLFVDGGARALFTMSRTSTVEVLRVEVVSGFAAE